MGINILRFLKGLFNSGAIAEGFVSDIECSYQKYKDAFTGYDPHFYLAQAWLAYMSARGEDIEDAAFKEAASTTTYQFACIPEPDCAKALGIFLLFRQDPDMITEHSYLEEEFNNIMEPVLKAQTTGTVQELYQKFNPKMASEYTGISEEDDDGER